MIQDWEGEFALGEFTAGVLFLTRDLVEVEGELKHLPLSYRLRPLNERWSVFFVRDEWLEQPSTIQSLRRISWAAPLLYFRYAEGKSWGFQIYDLGVRTATLHVDYGLIHTAYESDSGMAALSEQFYDCDVAAFEAFELEETDYDGLARILTPDFLLHSEHLFEQPNHFKMYLDIVEMYCIGYSALSDHNPPE